MKKFVAVAVVLGVGLVAGCGGGSGDGPGDVAVEFTAALVDKDGDRACDLMTKEVKKDLLEASILLGGGGCGETIVKAAELGDGSLEDLGDQEVASEKIDGSKAVVKLRGANEAIRLEKVDGRWLVAPDPEGSADSSEQDTADVTAGTIGSEARDGSLGYTVKSVKQVESVPPQSEYGESIEAEPGADLYQMTISIHNYGTKEVLPFCGAQGFVLLSDAKQEYTPEDLTDLCGDGIAPGFDGSASLGFRVPTGTALAELRLFDSEGDDSSGEGSYVTVPVSQ